MCTRGRYSRVPNIRGMSHEFLKIWTFLKIKIEIKLNKKLVFLIYLDYSGFIPIKNPVYSILESRQKISRK